MEAATVQQAEVSQAPERGAAAKWAAALFGAWMLARGAGAALAPMLLVQAPLGLLVLSPAWTNFILVSALVDHIIFVPVALVASVAQAALGYQVGRWWGSDALLAFERRPDGVLSRIRRMVERAAPAVVLVLPGPLVCTMAGIVGMRPTRFYPIMITAKAIWIGLCLTVGEALGGHIKALAGVVKENLVWITALALCWVIGRRLWRRLRVDAP
jgi:membrane protein DedA with SNARE-associated domain